jgi:hypothetical protein
MSALTPPFDIIPKLPGKGVNIIVNQVNLQTDRLVESVNKTVQDSIKLPRGASCDDPQVKKIKDELTRIQQQITNLREIVPKIQTTVNTVQTLVSTASSVKAAIAVAQLSNPVTAPLFIAQQLQAIQDATIANAIASLDQFKTIPETLTTKLAAIVPPLLSAIQRISETCNGDVDELELPQSVIDELGGGVDELGDEIDDYNDLLPSEFYNELNVSDEDLQQRSDTIESLVQQQRNLLSSLIEAPSRVYQEQGAPDSALGKLGDYYIDTLNKMIYGPKLDSESWGTGINY